MKEDHLSKAALAIFALANRTESAGKKDAASAKGAKWQPMPYGQDTVMDVERLREALDYHAIAESLHAPSVSQGYPRAMLLEAMGEWDGAIVAFESMGESGELGAKRCREKKAGTYDELAFIGIPTEVMDAMDGMDADAFFADFEASEPASQSPERGGNADAMGELALQFVNHLLDRNWSAARALLHPDETLHEDEMRDSFESLFEGEEFPANANIFDIHDDEAAAEILGWVYVTIDSENGEAVAVEVGKHVGHLVIRGVEFGRP